MVSVMARTTAFHEWIKARYDESGLSPTAFALQVGVNHLTMLGWLEEQTPPQRKTALRVGKYFGVSDAEILEMAGFGRTVVIQPDDRHPYTTTIGPITPEQLEQRGDTVARALAAIDHAMDVLKQSRTELEAMRQQEP